MSELFSWVHLSDIHFGHGGAEHGWDQKLVLDRLRQDLPKAIEKGAPRPDAIFVTGDVAFSGAGRTATEYADAKAWLLAVGAEVGVGAERIFVVPGNHDVNRNADRNRQTGRLIQSLRVESPSADASIDAALKDAGDRELIAQRMAAYLEFSRELAPWKTRADVPPAAQRLFWSETLQAREGLRVRLVGLNTSLLAADDTDAGRLQLGLEQVNFAILPSAAPDELVVVLTHHPFQGWLSDAKNADRWLQSGGAHLHLSGHVHEAGSSVLRHGSGAQLTRVTAGAAHGDALPAGIAGSHGYNFAAVMRGAGNKLVLRVWPRRWADASKSFRVDTDSVEDGEKFADHDLCERTLSPATAPADATTPAAATPAAVRVSATAGAKTGPIQVFLAYHPEDDDLRKRLETHLKGTLRKRIEVHRSRSAEAGGAVGSAVDEHLRGAQIVLLLLSNDYLASDYCRDVEMELARERSASGARVLPVVLRPVDLARLDDLRRKQEWFEQLQRYPRDGVPVTKTGDVDDAFTEVTEAVRSVVEAIEGGR